MSNVIGQLELQMVADLARIKQDMEAAKGIVGGAMADIQRYAGMATAALGAIGGVAIVSQLKSMVTGFIDAAEKLHDLSIQTGATVESLSALQAIGRTTDTSAETIAAAMNKLAKNMAVANEESKGTGQALKALGIDFEAFRALRPEDKLQQVAQAMAKFEDGSDKAAVAMTLLGKEGARMLPFLKDLTDKGKLVATVTTEQAAAADAYNDSLTESRMRMEAVQRSIAMGLLPYLVQLHETTTQLTAMFGQYLTSDLKKASNGFDVLEVAIQGVGVAMESLMVLGSDVGFVLKTLIGQVSAVREARAKYMAGDAAGGDKVWADFNAGAAEARRQLDEFQSKVVGATERLVNLRRATKADPTGSLASIDALFPEEPKQKLNYSAQAKEGADAYAKLLEQLQKVAEAGRVKAAEQLNEAETGRKLTDAEKDYIKVMSEVANGKAKMVDLQRLGIQQQLQENIVQAARAEAAKAEADWLRETAKANDEAAATRRKLTDDLQAQVDQEKESIATLGLSARQLAAHQAALLRDAAAAKDRAATEADLIDWTGKMSDELRRQADLLRERASLAEQGVAVKEAQAAAAEWQKVSDSIGNGITDAIIRGFEGGKDGARVFLDSVKALFKTTVLKILVQPVQTGLNNLLAGIFGQQQPAGGSMFGSLSGISSLYSQGSSLAGYARQYGGSAAAYLGIGQGTATGATNAALIESAAGSSGYGASSASSSGGLSAASYAAIAAAAYLRGSAEYGMGYTAASARQGKNDLFGENAIGRSFQNLSVDNLLNGLGKALGMSDKWASILSGSSAVAQLIGRRPAVVEGRNIVGTVGGDGFTGSFDVRSVEKGGWFRSDKTTITQSELSGPVVNLIDGMAKQLRDQAKGYADALGLPVEAISSFSKAINVDVTFSDAEESAKRISEAMKGYADGLFENVGRSVETLKKAGETTQQTLERLSTLQTFSKGLNELGGVFSRIASSSIDARENLIAMVGGMDALQAKAQSFVQNYYNRDEIAGVKAREVQQALAGAGLSTDLRTRDDFRALVENKNTTDAQLAVLLNVGDAFATLTDYLAETGGSLNSVAGQAPEMAKLGGLFVDGSTAQVAATNAVQAAVVEVRDAIVQLQQQVAQQPAAGGGRGLYDTAPGEVTDPGGYSGGGG